MQGDPEVLKVLKRLERIVEELEDINGVLKSPCIVKAIENLKIVLSGERKKRGTESYDHYRAKLRLVELFLKDGGSCYLEAEQTKISKIGYRPDAVVINDDEVVIIEIETDQRRMRKKLKRLKKILDVLRDHPIVSNRNLRIVFGVFGDVKYDVVKYAKDIGVEIYRFNGDLVKIV